MFVLPIIQLISSGFLIIVISLFIIFTVSMFKDMVRYLVTLLKNAWYYVDHVDIERANNAARVEALDKGYKLSKNMHRDILALLNDRTAITQKINKIKEYLFFNPSTGDLLQCRDELQHLESEIKNIDKEIEELTDKMKETKKVIQKLEEDKEEEVQS